jgi:hypothetical protein
MNIIVIKNWQNERVVGCVYNPIADYDQAGEKAIQELWEVYDKEELGTVDDFVDWLVYEHHYQYAKYTEIELT